MTTIYLIEGPVGAGKSTHARRLASEVRGVHMALDEWFARLYSPDRPTADVVPWYLARKDRLIDLLWAHDDGWHLVGVSRSRSATRLYLDGDLRPGTSTRDLADLGEPEAPEPPLMAEVELVDYDAAAMSQAIAAALRALWPEPGA